MFLGSTLFSPGTLSYTLSVEMMVLSETMLRQVAAW